MKKNKFLGIMSCLLLMIVLSSCTHIEGIHISSAQLLEERTILPNTEHPFITATGDILLTFKADTNLINAALKNEGKILIFGKTCKSGAKLGIFPYAFPINSDAYIALLSYKSLSGNSMEKIQYNLAIYPEDLCITIRIGGENMNLFKNFGSDIVRYRLSEALKKTLQEYERRGGSLEFQSTDYTREEYWALLKKQQTSTP